MTASAVLPDDLAHIVADPQSYADWDNLHEALKTVRKAHPFARAEIEGYNPFWVASKFEDIQTVARKNDVFLSGLGGLEDNATIEFAKKAGIGQMFRSIVSMNEPDHMKYRMLTQAWFQPKNLKPLEDGIRVIARRHVERLIAAGGECDFVKEVAVHYPLLVVMSILGVPEEDEPMMLRLTQQYFGNNDDELNIAHEKPTPEQAAAMLREVIGEANAYFKTISDDRRRNPTNDLISVVANSVIDGEPISDLDAMGYYITAAFAGHDTTSSSTSGGIWALCERPGELARVKADPSLIPALVEESIRWTTPIHQFTRMAAAEHEVRGQKVRKGDWVVLCFPSGNRDEDAFDDPFDFRTDRTSNKHIAFGYGAHMCLGMHLARMEMRIFFEELLPRLDALELAGTPRRTVTNFVGGPKSVPIRYRLS
ncbi:MAG: cytochrome P450 [Parvibaculum sp.]